MSRIWRRNPPLISVTVSGEGPASFQWQDKTYSITDITNHWRGKGGLGRNNLHRDYFKVVTRPKQWAEIFYDHLSDTWHLQEIYD